MSLPTPAPRLTLGAGQTHLDAGPAQRRLQGVRAVEGAARRRGLTLRKLPVHGRPHHQHRGAPRPRPRVRLSGFLAPWRRHHDLGRDMAHPKVTLEAQQVRAQPKG